MKHVTADDLLALNRISRLNFVNSCSGLKSASLIATQSGAGITNVAVFNSVIHLGSDPAMLCFMLRPLTVPRHTYSNIKESKVLTINHIHNDIISKAHQTSASYPKGVSEFEATGLQEEYLDEFPAPYVKESRIKLGCSYVNEYPIEENGCVLMVVKIEHIYFEEDIQEDDMWLRLDKAKSVACIGLDGYASTSLIDRFAYARPNKETMSTTAMRTNRDQEV